MSKRAGGVSDAQGNDDALSPFVRIGQAASPSLAPATDEDVLTAEEEEEAEKVARAAATAVTVIRDVDDRFVFRFEVGPAILAQVLQKLDNLEEFPVLEVVEERLSGLKRKRRFPGVEKYRGFYQLLHHGKLQYFGKTARAIGVRLFEHEGKLFGREGIDLKAMMCKYTFVEDPSLVDMAEGTLISHFGHLAAWNASGFGSKVTGAGRFDQKPSEWQNQFPPTPDVLVDGASGATLTLEELLKKIARPAPLNISVPKALKAAFRNEHPGKISFPSSKLPWVKWVEIFESKLGKGWEVKRGPENWVVKKK